MEQKKCNICGKDADKPYRVYMDEKILQGCVSSFHTGHLVPFSQDAYWHERKEAKQVRKMIAKFGC